MDSPTVAATVRYRLARARAAGVPFDDAWRDATADVPVGANTWAAALDSTRSAWRLAYQGEPGPLCGAWDLLLSSRR